MEPRNGSARYGSTHAQTEVEPLTPDAKPAAAAAINVVGVDPELGFGGGETQVMGLTLALGRLGHRAELICDPAGRLWERARAEGVKCHALRIRNAIDLPAGVRLRSIIRRERYDVVHFHTSRAHAMAPFARGFAHALVVTRRMDYLPNRVFAPYLFNRAVDGVIAISNGVAASLTAAGVNGVRITRIHSGVDVERFRPPSESERSAARAALAVAGDEIAIAAVGALEPRKGHRYLIDAVAALKKSAPALRIRCLIAGHGSIRAELERHIAQVGCGEQVTLLGRVDSTLELLWAADIFAMPSLKEGLGVAALEAMACAMPVVASNAGGLPDVVENDRTGILVAPANSGELAHALRGLAESAEIRSSMGRAGRIRAESEFSIAAMAEQTLALYRRCLSSRAGKAGALNDRS